MTSIEEFIEVRKSIEALAGQIALCVEHKTVQDSKQRFDEATQKLEVLKTMVANDVQVVVANRLTRHLTGLGTKLETMAAKRVVKKSVAKKKVLKES